MLRRHLVAIAAITHTPSLEYRVRRYFGLGSRPLIIELRQAELSHADIVLALLRINTSNSRRLIASLMGKPITIGPACRLVWPDNRQLPLVRTQPTVVAVNMNIVVRRRTRLHACLPEFRVGRTLDQLRMRGVTRGDIKRAVRRGVIQLTGGKA